MEEAGRVTPEAGDVGYLRTAKHKTALTYGSAEVVLDAEVLQWFLMYRDIVRPMIGFTRPDDLLFATMSGTKCANPVPDLAQIAKAAGLPSVPTATANRKLIATAVAGTADDTERRHVANLMQHSVKTANE